MLFKKKKNMTIAPEIQSPESLRYEVANLQGVGRRERQEDSFTFMNALDEKQYLEYGLMFAVCDGMGGMKDGKLASETAVTSLKNHFSAMERRGQFAEQLKISILSASEEVEELLGGYGGSTVVAGIIIHEQLYFASVGDSYFYFIRNGSIYRLNVEQNLCHERYLQNIREGSCDPIECRNDPEATVLAQFLGMPDLTNVDCCVRPLLLRKGDILLACSDGVGGVLTEEEILACLNPANPHEMCAEIEKRLTEHANPNQDNYTALIVKCV